jgi:hypothetical protein
MREDLAVDEVMKLMRAERWEDDHTNQIHAMA